MIVSIIAAIGQNRELGKNNQLLWHIPQDLDHFKKITTNHPVIMGRTTFESMGKPLPKRTNIIITHNNNYQINYSSNEKRSSLPIKSGSNNNTIIAHSLEEAISIARKYNQDEAFIIGGGKVYHQAINQADKLYLTIVHEIFAADTFFPDYSQFKKIIKQEELTTPQYQLTFLELEKQY